MSENIGKVFNLTRGQSQSGGVPATREINGKPLSSDITLTASDVGAAESEHTHTAADVGARPDTWTPTAAEVGAVPTTRTVNGKALSADITLSASDVGAAASGHTHTAASVGAVPTTRKINSKALSADVTLSASDVGAAASGHTHTPASIGAAASGHTHTAADVGALPIGGGTLTGDLRIKGSGNYGTKINLGDGDYVHISEPTDDCMEIKAKKINFVTSANTDDKFTLNGEKIGDLTAILQRLTAVEQKAAQALQTAEESYFVGYYNGTGRALYVELGWQPKLVLVAGMKTSTTQGDYSTFDHYFAMTGRGDGLSKRIEISAKGFTVYPDNYQGAWHPSLIENGRRYDYIAFK